MRKVAYFGKLIAASQKIDFKGNASCRMITELPLQLEYKFHIFFVHFQDQQVELKSRPRP